jgi:hypothetical protein
MPCGGLAVSSLKWPSAGMSSSLGWMTSYELSISKQSGTLVMSLIVEMRGMRDEFHRLKAVEAAIDVERDPNTLLN